MTIITHEEDIETRMRLKEEEKRKKKRNTPYIPKR